ncbi:hypothetical protein [Kaistia algarum]|uniref:hypothetical protein n=1 Tax=Kaistia algarum TaxID=2083279 RepID=UPI00140287B2|nr:hypothetical protein [Kaistia algarum]MCX5516580.1 hypothetical protein [Kaistia algarum]
MNRIWHDTHPMPNKATLEERVAWHVEHARECGCRAIPASVLAELERRGLQPPPRKS